MANASSNRLLQALLRIDPTTGFVDYVKTVKPYHTKILEVDVTYVWTDAINATIQEQYEWDMAFTRPDVQTAYDCGFGIVYDPPFGYTHTQYFIKGVVPGIGGSWTISGNHTDIFTNTPGHNIFVVGLNNGGGNGFYTVVSSVHNVIPDTTTITVVERIGAGFNIIDTVIGHGGAELTGLANNATVYTATITIDGVAHPVSAVGSANQTYGALLATINAAIAGFGLASLIDGLIRVESNTTGPLSTVSIVDTGPNFLFASLTGFITFAPSVGTTPTPQGVVYSFDTIPETVLSTVPSTGPYGLANSFLVQGNKIQKFFEGALVVVDDTCENINNGDFIVQASQLETGNTRVWVKQSVNDLPVSCLGNGTGRMYLDREGYDEPTYCRLAQASDIHMDVFIHEKIVFDFDDTFSIKFFDLISATVTEDAPGDPSFNGKLAPTALTTAIVLLPTGLDGNPFDMGGLDESAGTVNQFYGLTIS